MKKSVCHVLVLFLLAILHGAAQNTPNVPSASWVSNYLDSIQPHTPLYVHAYCHTVSDDISTANKTTLSDTKVLYSWIYSTPQMSIQVGLSKLNIDDLDTLKVFSKNKLMQVFTRTTLLQNRLVSAAGYEQVKIVLISHPRHKPKVHLHELILTPNIKLFKTDDFGDSQSCQVNVNCAEGDDYQDIKRSVVRIAVRLGNVEGWCSGTLVNNTAYNYEPLLLSAEHCGLLGTQFASTQDLNAWRFYFNYQSPNCLNPVNEGNLDAQVIGGATLLARSDDQGGETGSDFLLLKLSINVPEVYNAYYAGWNRSETTIPFDGVSLHHPAGDIKKISFMRGTAANTSFGGLVQNTHWLTRWKSTANGFGTTESGSSGAALFDANRLCVGVLTGGSSSCANTDASDFYGKLSYGWTSDGTSDDRQLKPWLDPLNTGVIAIPGANLNEPPASDSLSFSVLPNPTNGSIKIAGLGSIEASVNIEVFSLNGAIVYQQETLILPNIPLTLDFTELKNGLYIFKIRQGEQLFVSKVLIEN